MADINTRMKEAITAIKAGDKRTGREILQSVLAEDPENEAALLWMTKVVDTPAEQLVYVERVLYVNPNNEPAQKLKAHLEKGSRLAEVRPPDRSLATDDSLTPNFQLISIPQPLVVKFPTKQTLTFSDGLNFGMGLLVASLLFTVCILPLGVGALVIVLQALGLAIGQATR